jgi:hypothetical protein
MFKFLCAYVSGCITVSVGICCNGGRPAFANFILSIMHHCGVGVESTSGVVHMLMAMGGQ